MKELLIVTMFVVGGLTMVLGQIVGIGYVLYLWGAVGLAFSASLWTGFLLWIKMILGGATLSFISTLMRTLSKKPY